MIVVRCDNCGTELRRIPAKVNQHNFCSYACHHAWMSEHWHPSPAAIAKLTKSVTLRCEQCGKEFERNPCHTKGITHHYCSNVCRGKAMAGKPGPNPKTSIIVTCDQCGKAFERQPSLINRGLKHTFCSHQCKLAWKAAHIVNPIRAGHERAQAAFPLKPCEVCGISPETVRIHRHHKDLNPLNNDRDNIAYLCSTHHLKLHHLLRKAAKEEGEECLLSRV